MPVRFTGMLNQLTLTTDRPQLTSGDEKRLAEARRNDRPASSHDGGESLGIAIGVDPRECG